MNQFEFPKWDSFAAMAKLSARAIAEGSGYRLYAIQLETDGPYKFGIARDPVKRLRALQIGSPFPLTLRASIPGCSELERRIHYFLRDQRMRGEWFKPSERTLKVFKWMKWQGGYVKHNVVCSDKNRARNVG